MRHFDLVQRLEQLPPAIESANPVMEVVKVASANGMGAISPMDRDIDPVRHAGLGFDYMGSSEFEFGVIPESAHRIVSDSSKLVVVSQTLTRPTYEEPVHFICTDEQAETVLPVWQEWSQNPLSLERPHYFRDADRDSVGEDDRTIAWWALNEDLLWTRDGELAETLKEGFSQRKRELFTRQSLRKR